MTMDDESYYQGQKIILTPSQYENGKWICRFMILRFRKPETEKQSGYAEGSFGSRHEAEAAALAKAKAMIDSHRPTEGLYREKRPPQWAQDGRSADGATRPLGDTGPPGDGGDRTRKLYFHISESYNVS